MKPEKAAALETVVKMVEDRLTVAGFAIAAIVTFASLQVVHCGPSAQQEHELLLLDALSRKQISSSNLNAISSNNYESNAIMDMLGRSMLFEVAFFENPKNVFSTFAFT